MKFKKNIFLLICFACGSYTFKQLEDRLDHLLYTTFFCLFYVGIERYMNYSVVDINNSLKDDVNIGAFWAHQAFEFYYKIVLNSLNDRIQKFETEHNVILSVRKLIICIPLSCNVNGTFDERDKLIHHFGYLPVVECDQGGNYNRQYKNPVYKICSSDKNCVIADKKYVSAGDLYIVSEFASPLATLWYTRGMSNLKKEIWNYHRECIVKTLKKLIKNTPCIVVEYDDATESLSNVLMSVIREEGISLTP